MANGFKHASQGTVLTQTEYEAEDTHVLDSQATGDVIYASSSTVLRRLAVGSTGAVLTVTGGVPVWDTTWTPTGDLIPASDDSYDLGSASAAWQDLFLEGDITLTDAGTISTTAGSLSITPASGSAIVLDTSTTLDGGVLTFTPSTDDTVVMTAATNGAFSLVTTDNAAAAANIQITADGTVDIDSAGVLTLDSGAAINIEPASGSAILLDGTISIDAGVVTGATSITSTAFVGDITGDVTGNADTATLATTVTATANNSTDETVYPTFVDGATSAQGIETDTGLTYNPSTGVLTSTTFTGNLTGNVTGNTSGTAATVTTAAQTNITSLGTLSALTVSGLITANGGITFAAGDDITFTGGTGTNDIVLANGLADALSITDGSADVIAISTAGGTNTVAITGDLTVSGTIAADTAAVATTVTVTDNESTDEANAIIFTAGGDLDGGNLGLESDGTLNYNPSTGTLTTTTFAGALTGNVTGTADVATVATTVTITDNESTDESNALIFTAGGDVDGGNIGLESDGTLTYNPSTGKVTATGFVGTLTGNVTGNVSGTAATVTGATQGNITAVGTLGSIDIDGGAIDGTVIGANSAAAITGTAVTGTSIVGGTVAGTTGTFSGVVDVTDTTDASDATGDTGALRTEGGASIAKKLYVGTDLDVDGTAELDNITIAGAQGSDGQVLTSTGSGVGWEDAGGGGGGIVEADIWRMTSECAGSCDPMVNWERADGVGAAKVGTGMSYSSGIFTFPSAGIWSAEWYMGGDFGSATAVGMTASIQVTTDNGSSYDVTSDLREPGHGTSFRWNMALAALFDVSATNTSYYKMKFVMATTGNTYGNTDVNQTYVVFKKLGDT